MRERRSGGALPTFLGSRNCRSSATIATGKRCSSPKKPIPSKKKQPGEGAIDGTGSNLLERCSSVLCLVVSNVKLSCSTAVRQNTCCPLTL